MPTRPQPGALNATTVPVTDYAVDPRGRRFFGATLVSNAPGGVAAASGYAYPGQDGSGVRAYHGDYTQTALQRFTGTAALALYGTAKPLRVQDGFERSAPPELFLDGRLRVFAERMRRIGVSAGA